MASWAARSRPAVEGQEVEGEVDESSPEAGRGNRALVAEGYATMPAPGTYRLAAVVCSAENAMVAATNRPEG